MYNWKWLEDELEEQKKVIVEKEGKVEMENGHLTPFEITRGIGTIPHQDLTVSTATEQDVSCGYRRGL